MTVEQKPLPTELIDALLADYEKPEDLIGQNGILKQLTKALVERALQAELTDHLGHGKNQLVANETGNTRNGRRKKTLKGDFGELPIEIPRDRAGTFESQIITKHQTRWSGFENVSVFFDTNVLVYCTDTTAPEKQAITRALVSQASASGDALVSTQVLIELFNVLTRKQQMPRAHAKTLVMAYMHWAVVPSDVALVTTAIEKSMQHQLSIWDAMVIEAALRGRAQTLYTEDMSHGQRFDSLTVVNPFMDA